MLLSIVIPHFKNIKNLKKCISNLEVFFKKSIFINCIEVIIVDDGSRQINFLKKIKLKKNFTIYFLKKNNGPGIARNFGISKSKGKYLFFLDCDDTLNLNSLISLISLTKKNYDIIFFNWVSVNKNKKNRNQRKDFKFFKLNKYSLIKKYISMQMETSVIFSIFKKNFVEKNKIIFSKGIHEDINFMFKSLCLSKKIFFLDKNIYIKKNYKHSITNNFSNKHIFYYLLSWNKIRQFLIINFGKTFFSKFFDKNFTKGLAGLVAILILKNYLFKDTLKNKIKKYNYLNKYIYMNFFSYLLKLAQLRNSDYDKICSSYVSNILSKNFSKSVTKRILINWERAFFKKIDIIKYKKKFKII